MSAAGRRLRLAVEELRAAAVATAEGRPGRRPAGRSATWLAVVAHDALFFARSSARTLCLQQALGEHAEGVGLTQCWRGGAELARPGPGAEEGGSGAAAGAAGAEVAGPPGRPGLYAVRSSIAVAELLPALSRGVQVCAELVGRGEGGQGGGRRCMGAGGDAGVDDDTVMMMLDCAVVCAVFTLRATGLPLAKHAEAVVRQQQQQQQDAGTAAAAAGVSGSGGGDGGHCDGVAVSGDGAQGHGAAVGGSGGGGADTPWRQLLLRDVRLMELLGAALELHAQGTAAAAAGLLGAGNTQQELGDLQHILVHTLCKAACVFPGEFRAAVDRAGGCAAQMNSETAAASGRGTGGQGHGACMPLAALEAITKTDDDHPDAHRLLMHVLDGQVLPASAVTVRDVPDAYRAPCGIQLERVPEALRVLLPPAEARAAVAAAAAATATASAARTADGV